MKYIFLLVVCMASLYSEAQSFYSTDKIPAALKNKTNAVIRLDEQIFTRKTVDKATIQRHVVITVLNEKGDDDGVYLLQYDKLNKIKSLKGKLYDDKGHELAVLKKSDLVDYSSDYGSHNVSEKRQRMAFFPKVKLIYPYTVEYISTVETRNLLFYPNLEFRDYLNTGIEKIVFVINTPRTFSVRYREINMPSACSVTQTEKIKTYTWLVENRVISEPPVFLPVNQGPCVVTSPVEFALTGHYGRINNWEDVSRFYYELNKDRDELPEKIRAKVQDLIKDEPDTLKKIEKLYAYLQSTTHYMNVSLGISGWQTIKAMDVGKKGLGDCKALCNYMQALLKEAGIRSFSALINSGNAGSNLPGDFPCMSFNHIITCIPLVSDTVWLECTNQQIPANYIGSFTGNRKALTVLPAGGAFVNTIQYSSSENIKNRKVVLTLDHDGNAKGMVNAFYSGLAQEEFNHIFHGLDKENQKKALLRKFRVSNVSIEKFSMTEFRSSIPVIETNQEISIKKLINKTGAHVFIKPNIFGDFISTPLNDEPRTIPFFLDPSDYNFQTSDTITYHLPQNYTVDYIPPPVKLSSAFGTYAASFTMNQDTLIYTRTITMKGGTFPPSDFLNFVDFVKKVNKSETLSVAFIDKN